MLILRIRRLRVMRLLFVFVLIVAPGLVVAQGLQLAFSSFNQDANQPIEVAADAMSIDQDDGTVVMTGNVVIVQGDLRLSAPKASVDYTDEGGISQLFAEGGVTLVTPEEEAESATALYTLDDDQLLLRGDVLLIQGRNAVTSDVMRINLETGTAFLEGRVRTVLQPNE